MRFLYAVIFFVMGCHKSPSLNDSLPIGTIAFVNKSENIDHIWLMDIDGSGKGSHARRSTRNAEAENYPSWSPDGKRLVFQRDFNGSAIYIMDADGQNQYRLSQTPGFDVTPSWSPDGKQIIYTRVLGLMVAGQIPKTEIRVINADARGVAALRCRWDTQADWESDDGANRSM